MLCRCVAAAREVNYEVQQPGSFVQQQQQMTILCLSIKALSLVKCTFSLLLPGDADSNNSKGKRRTAGAVREYDGNRLQV
jgi:hypothetical protein